MSLRLVIAAFAFLAAFDVVPRWLSATPVGMWSDEVAPDPAFLDAWDRVVDEERVRRAAHERAIQGVATALEASAAYLALPRDPTVLDAAASAAIDRRYEEARALAERVLEVAQPAEVERRARDVAGHAALQLGDGASALGHLERAQVLAAEDDPIAGFRLLWLAEAAFEADAMHRAVTAAVEAQPLLTRDVALHQARFVEARAMLQIEALSEQAIERLDALLARYPEYPHQDRVTLDLAWAEVRHARYRDALRRVDAWEWEHPFHAWAAEAQNLLELLDERGYRRPERTLDEQMQRGRQMRLTRHWATARPILASALQRCTAGRYATSTCNDIRFQIVLNEYDSAEFHASLAMLNEIEATGSAGISTREIAKWRGRALSRVDREEEAYEVMDAYWRLRGETAHAREMGEFAYDLGMYDRALAHYRTVWGASTWSTFDGAFLLYLADEHDDAIDAFLRVAARTSGTDRSRAEYWLARSYEQVGRRDDAMAIYADLADQSRVRYYNLQAANRLEEWQDAIAIDPAATARVERPGRIHWHGSRGEARASLADARATATTPLFEPYAPSVRAPGAVAAAATRWGDTFPDLHRAAALVSVGAQEDARRALREVLTEFTILDRLFSQGRRPGARRPIRIDVDRWEHEIDNRRDEAGWWGVRLEEPRYPVPGSRSALEAYADRQRHVLEQRVPMRLDLRAAAREVADHFMVRRMVIRDEDLPGLMDQEADRSGWFEAYPHAYGHVAEPTMEAHDLNPYLLWSLMIVESDLNPDSVSVADAYGLLQVIPKTGELIASGFGEPDFGIHDLIEIEHAFEYGAWYLSELLEKFDGQEMLAAVAYNAGPHQVARWLDWRGDILDMDEFIETVPYDGARRYPQKLLRYLLTYRLVYGESDRVYLGNALDADYEDNIYY